MHLRGDVIALEQLSREGICPVTSATARSIAQKLNAVKYMECSVKTYQGLKNVFDETVAATLTYDHPRKKKTLFDHFWSKFG